jgi:hypothetical protein
MTAYTDECKMYHTITNLLPEDKPVGSLYVVDIKKLKNINLGNVHFIGLYHTIILPCTVQKYKSNNTSMQLNLGSQVSALNTSHEILKMTVFYTTVTVLVSNLYSYHNDTMVTKKFKSESMNGLQIKIHVSQIVSA